MRQVYQLMLLPLLLASNISFAAYSGSVSATCNGREQTLSISINEGTTVVTIVMEYDSNKWFGWGIDTTDMTGDAWVFYDGSNGIDFYDMNMTGVGVNNVHEDASQDITASYVDVGGRVTVTGSRSGVAGDPGDVGFSAEDRLLNVSYACGSSLTMAYHTDRGATSASILPPIPESFDLEGTYRGTRVLELRQVQ